MRCKHVHVRVAMESSIGVSGVKELGQGYPSTRSRPVMTHLSEPKPLLPSFFPGSHGHKHEDGGLRGGDSARLNTEMVLTMLE